MKKHTCTSLYIDNIPIYVIDDEIKPLKEELESFLDGMDYMKSKEFSLNTLFPHEIQANNIIEGYQDDASFIDAIIHHTVKISDEKRKKRILNLYRGYKYIFEGKDINEDTLRHLYKILSEGLLDTYDLRHMGKYYRQAPVYIYYSSNIGIAPDEGVDYHLIREKMQLLLAFLNETPTDCLTDTFLVSQLAKIYFYYIHPYFDINGRTARTTAMWHLLNKEAYPFIIFNRGIQLAKQEYYKVIRDVKKYRNATFFLNYMMIGVKKELEKEYIIDMITQSSGKLSTLEYQTLQYILSMRGEWTYYDFASYYNHANDKKSRPEVIQTMIEPLIDKGIIIPGRTTKCSKEQNRFFTLNEAKYEIDPDKVKRISLVTKDH